MDEYDLFSIRIQFLYDIVTTYLQNSISLGNNFRTPLYYCGVTREFILAFIIVAFFSLNVNIGICFLFF